MSPIPPSKDGVEVGTVRDFVKRAMTTVCDIGIPLHVSVNVGDTRLEAH